MKSFRKRPLVIKAIQITEDTFSDPNHEHLIGPVYDPVIKRVYITTLEGLMTATIGDWIIVGIKGEMYPCKDEIFRATYEEVDPDPETDTDLNEILETVNKVCLDFLYEPIDQVTFDKIEHLAEVALKENGYEATLTCNNRTNTERTALRNALGLELTYKQRTYKLEFRNDLAITMKNGEVWVVTE